MAVTTLRQRKHRPDKPFAVMMGFQSIDGLPEPYRGALEALSRPVVLVPKTLAPAVVESVAPGLSECGLLLPDSPLHALLVEAFQGPLVTTSANLSGEPILTSLEDAEYSLSGIADGFLHHDRDILRPADDSVFRLIGESLRPLRIGRGSAPYEFQLQEPVEGCLLAVGGDLKNTIAMASGDRVIVSPHVGDLSSARSLDVFEGVIRDLSRLYGWSPDRMVCDAHPDYRTGHWARAQGLPVMAVYHHHAHAAALYEEFKTEGPLLIFAFDGLGYGEAGELWGGEVLWGEPGHWQRVGSLRPLPLPGGDRASREPWRLGVALAQASGLGSSFVHEGSEALLEFLERGIAVPMTSSMGRLFDAAAALAGVCTHQTHEGQAAMRLEALSHRGGAVLELPITQEGPLLRWNWEPLVSMLLNPQWTAAEKGSIFHATIAGAVVALIDHWGQSHPRTPVGLTGGVFQNKLLVEEIQRQLEGRATTLLIPKAVPLNDAGLSFGQLVEAGAVLRAKIGGLNLADRGRG
jgi:hydrogenase maturation protein HypF